MSQTHSTVSDQSLNYCIITYGCQMNISDSERISSFLEKNGCQPVFKLNEADLIVISSCSVRQSATNRIFGQVRNILNLKKQNPGLRVILTGCVLPADKNKFRKYFDAILDIKDLPQWLKGSSQKVSEDYFKIKPIYKNKFSALVPVSNGCDNFCTYCAVPYTRGRLFCRDHKEIVSEVKELVIKKYKEIWLLGQNVNNYRSPSDSKVDFGILLKEINKIKGAFWIRFTSPHPKNFSDEIIRAMATSKKVTPYLNLPVQSGDDEILKKMSRPYKIEDYKSLVDRIRKDFRKYRKGLEKDIAISTDLIVGFPGETQKQFQSSLRLFQEMNFDMAYIAEFSPRPNTAASEMKDSVTQKEKEKRKTMINDALRKTALKNNQKYINKKIEVLVEEKTKNGLLGKTRSYKTVKFDGPDKLIGKTAKVKITEVSPWGLNGILV